MAIDLNFATAIMPPRLSIRPVVGLIRRVLESARLEDVGQLEDDLVQNVAAV